MVVTSNHTLNFESFDARQAEGPNGWYVETASLFRTTNPRLLVRHRQVSSEIYKMLTCSMKGKLFNRIPQNVSRIVQSNTKLNVIISRIVKRKIWICLFLLGGCFDSVLFLATEVGSTCTVDGATLKGPFSAVPANNNASRVMHRFLLILLTLTIGNSRHREDLQCVHSLPRSARRSPWSTRG